MLDEARRRPAKVNLAGLLLVKPPPQPQMHYRR